MPEYKTHMSLLHWNLTESGCLHEMAPDFEPLVLCQDGEYVFVGGRRDLGSFGEAVVSRISKTSFAEVSKITLNRPYGGSELVTALNQDADFVYASVHRSTFGGGSSNQGRVARILKSDFATVDFIEVVDVAPGTFDTTPGRILIENDSANEFTVVAVASDKPVVYKIPREDFTPGATQRYVYPYPLSNTGEGLASGGILDMCQGFYATLFDLDAPSLVRFPSWENRNDASVGLGGLGRSFGIPGIYGLGGSVAYLTDAGGPIGSFNKFTFPGGDIIFNYDLWDIDSPDPLSVNGISHDALNQPDDGVVYLMVHGHTPANVASGNIRFLRIDPEDLTLLSVVTLAGSFGNPTSMIYDGVAFYWVDQTGIDGFTLNPKTVRRYPK